MKKIILIIIGFILLWPYLTSSKMVEKGTLENQVARFEQAAKELLIKNAETRYGIKRDHPDFLWELTYDFEFFDIVVNFDPLSIEDIISLRYLVHKTDQPNEQTRRWGNMKLEHFLITKWSNWYVDEYTNKVYVIDDIGYLRYLYLANDKPRPILYPSYQEKITELINYFRENRHLFPDNKLKNAQDDAIILFFSGQVSVKNNQPMKYPVSICIKGNSHQIGYFHLGYRKYVTQVVVEGFPVFINEINALHDYFF